MMRTHCICGKALDEPWHDANCWNTRFSFKGISSPTTGELKLRTPGKCNPCHCPHHDCDSASCEEYHADMDGKPVVNPESE